MRMNLSPYEARLIRYLERWTYGWNRIYIELNLARIARALDIDRANVKRALKALSERRIVLVERNHENKARVAIEPNVRRWLKKPVKQFALEFKRAAEETAPYG